jgi:hypothetical protein
MVGQRYDLIFAEPPASLDAASFWRTTNELCAPSTLVLLGGTHRDVAPFLAQNLVVPLSLRAAVQFLHAAGSVQMHVDFGFDPPSKRQWAPQSTQKN